MCSRSSVRPPVKVDLSSSPGISCGYPGPINRWRNVSMSSRVEESFDELWQRLRAGRGLADTGDDPVFYLVFRPEEMLEVKRLCRLWSAKLGKQGWKME